MQQFLKIDLLLIKSCGRAMQQYCFAIRRKMSRASGSSNNLHHRDSASRIEDVTSRPIDLSKHINDARARNDNRVPGLQFEITGCHFRGISRDRYGSRVLLRSEEHTSELQS